MSNVLHVTSSPRVNASYSNQVSHGVIEAADKALERATEQARDVVQARQTLIAELEWQRRALAAAA